MLRKGPLSFQRPHERATPAVHTLVHQTYSDSMSIKKSSLHFVLLCLAALAGLMLWSQPAGAQANYTWDQIKSKFEVANPTLKADAITVQEMKAAEITAFLRPNPTFTLSTD